MSKGNRLHVTHKIDSHTFVVGSMKKVHVLPPLFLDALIQPGHPGTNYTFFNRLKQNRFFYVAEDYGRGSRDSACVMYQSDQDDVSFGAVKTFVKITECACAELCNHYGVYVALLQRFVIDFPFKVTEMNVSLTNILSCSLSGTVDIVPIQKIHCVCFRMTLGSDLFLSVPLNEYELE
jgi:hypothetical protein